MRKPEGNRPLGRPERRWEDNIKMYLKEEGWKDMDWLHVTQDGGNLRVLQHGNEILCYKKCGEFLNQLRGTDSQGLWFIGASERL